LQAAIASFRARKLGLLVDQRLNGWGDFKVTAAAIDQPLVVLIVVSARAVGIAYAGREHAPGHGQIATDAPDAIGHKKGRNRCCC
jgi:hypothetical protein